ncbi:hypothetical protein U9M48_023050 [Paspalum notatum var. saurae]|uniref:Uncharacterized protein n=1 Tax=Paspalum notatum var. saurae TaxID=547442 RepID=A0AAQ3WVI7_PASNO
MHSGRSVSSPHHGPNDAVQNSSWDLKDSIRQKLLNPVHVPSSYDTAWVAMVPAQGASEAPRFPGYVEWILQNQHSDGSWGLGHLDPCRLRKDAISSTLACILALKTWNVGHEHIMKGLQFIEKNSSFIMDEKNHAPVGFNIVFPAMIRSGIELGLELPLNQSDVDAIFHLREMELQRTMNGDSMALGSKAYMAYIAEGLADIMDWEKVLTYQRKNGSLFNSPSATAALAIHSYNANALKYLEFLGNKFVSSAPAAYPLNLHTQLCTVDMLENMGISSHFSSEINSILDTTYRSILQNDEDIIMDMETCATAFRILRMHEYDISSDVLSQFAEESRFHDSVEGHLNDTKALLELYKASLACISKDERSLQNIGSWSTKLLKQQLSSDTVSAGSVSPQEVEYSLRFPFYSSILDPLQHKSNIESFDTKSLRMQKTAYLACNAPEEIQALAAEDFRRFQSVYQKEFEHIDRWWKEVGLDQLKFVRVMRWDVFVYLASMVFPPELYDAAVAWIRCVILTIVVDDFFDYGGSAEELKNFVSIIEKWVENEGKEFSPEFCSEQVGIIFRAVYDTNNDIAQKAAVIQDRTVIHHIAEVWLDWVRTMMLEAEWTWKSYVPTMEEYLPNGAVSIGLGIIVVPSVYLVGPKLSEEMVRHPEYQSLLWHMFVCHRLENDIGTYKKEMRDGYINSVLLLAFREDNEMGPASIDAAKAEVRGLIADSRRELLKLLVSEGGVIPRPCRDVFWNTDKITHRFYSEGDGFNMPKKLIAAVQAVVHDPLPAGSD